MRSLGWGVAGYGDVVVRRVLPALFATGQQPLVLWGRREERASATAKAFGIARSTSDVRDLLSGVDAVYVATPVLAHMPLASAALRAGIPVLVEKPLRGGLRSRAGAGAGAGPDANWDRLDARPAQGGPGPVAGVAYYRRLAPVLGELSAYLAERAVSGPGQPIRAQVRFAALFDPAVDDPMYWRTETARSGGGVLADAGSHRIDLLCRLLGRPSRVAAHYGDRFPGGAEREARLRLEWPDGSSAHGTFRWLRPDGAEASGPEDSFHLSGADWEALVDPLDSGSLTVRGRHARRVTLPPGPNQHVPLIRDFVDAVVLGRPPVCPLADALVVDEVLLAADGSAAGGGQPISMPVPPVPPPV